MERKREDVEGVLEEVRVWVRRGFGGFEGMCAWFGEGGVTEEKVRVFLKTHCPYLSTLQITSILAYLHPTTSARNLFPLFDRTPTPTLPLPPLPPISLPPTPPPTPHQPPRPDW